jgi:hypothetical protein
MSAMSMCGCCESTICREQTATVADSRAILFCNAVCLGRARLCKPFIATKRSPPVLRAGSRWAKPGLKHLGKWPGSERRPSCISPPPPPAPHPHTATALVSVGPRSKKGREQQRPCGGNPRRGESAQRPQPSDCTVGGLVCQGHTAAPYTASTAMYPL